MTLDVDERVLLIERMVAERHAIGAGIEQVGQDGFGDAEAASGIFAVDDDEIECIALDETGKRVANHVSARATDDIAEKQKTHQEVRIMKSRQCSGPEGVRTQSSLSS